MENEPKNKMEEKESESVKTESADPGESAHIVKMREKAVSNLSHSPRLETDLYVEKCKLFTLRNCSHSVCI